MTVSGQGGFGSLLFGQKGECCWVSTMELTDSKRGHWLIPWALTRNGEEADMYFPVFESWAQVSKGDRTVRCACANTYPSVQSLWGLQEACPCTWLHGNRIPLNVPETHMHRMMDWLRLSSFTLINSHKTRCIPPSHSPSLSMYVPQATQHNKFP